MDELYQKKEKLITSLRGLEKAAVAFSAGVDSAFLLKCAQEALGDQVLAVTGRFASFPDREQSEAETVCREWGIPQITVELDQLGIPGFADNPPDRCYLCKKELFSEFLKAAAQRGFSILAEGSNADDDRDFRPGMRAVKELGIISPLQEAGLTKAGIRELSRQMGLPVWDKPSFACLATRIPYGEQVTREKLSMISRAEQYLMDLGIRQVRVRLHGSAARIEVNRDDFSRILDPVTAENITCAFQRFGFSHAALDLTGYRTGSMNAGLVHMQDIDDRSKTDRNRDRKEE